MIEISNVYKKFGNVNVLENITLNISKGQIYGIIGENGAGKTTLIRCLTGIYKPDSGKILVEGQEVYDNPEIKKYIGYVADTNQFFPYYTIKELIKFYKSVYQEFSEDKFNELNKEFNLNVNQRVIKLSKGMQMRLAFIMALSIKPKILVLDEPTSGLDALAKNKLLNILVEEVEKNNLTVFIATHHLNELEKICDKMCIFQNGNMTYETNMEQLKNAIKKYQVVFKNPPENLNNIKGVLATEKIGSIYYFIVDGTTPFNKTLIELGADVIDEINLTLEEIFIHTINRGALNKEVITC